MAILILLFFLISAKKIEKRTGFYKLSFCFFYFSHIPRIPIPIPRIPTPISCIPTLIPRISLILFPDFPFWLLQMACIKKELAVKKERTN